MAFSCKRVPAIWNSMSSGCAAMARTADMFWRDKRDAGGYPGPCRDAAVTGGVLIFLVLLILIVETREITIKIWTLPPSPSHEHADPTPIPSTLLFCRGGRGARTIHLRDPCPGRRRAPGPRDRRRSPRAARAHSGRTHHR